MQFAFKIKVFKRVLAQPFVHGNGYGIGKIEAPRIAEHRNPQTVFGVGFKQFFGQSPRFLSEDEEIAGL